MSIQALSYVLQQSKVKLWDRLVLISLANHANDRALSWPAVQTIAHEAGIGQRTVQRSLRRLEARGEIEPLGPLGVDRNGRTYIQRVENRKSVTYWLCGFVEWRLSVGDTTAEIPRQTNGNRGFSPQKPDDRVRKTPSTPPGRRGYPAKGGTPTPPYMAPPVSHPDGVTLPRVTPTWAKADTHTPPRVAPEVITEPSEAQTAPPNPPAGGAPQTQLAPIAWCMTGPGGVVKVTPAPSARTLRAIERGSMAGGRLEDYAEYFRRNGYQCEVIYE